VSLPVICTAQERDWLASRISSHFQSDRSLLLLQHVFRMGRDRPHPCPVLYVTSAANQLRHDGSGTRTGWFLIVILPPERRVVNDLKALG